MSCAVSMTNCTEEKQAATNLTDSSNVVDLSTISKAYDWYQHYEGADKDSILYEKLNCDLPDDEFYLFEDTSFVLRVPQYAHSKQPFLCKAEDFYNACQLAWNGWSNFEVWYRGHTSDLLRSDEDVRRSLEAISVDFINDMELRQAAKTYKDSLLRMMRSNPDKWDEDFFPMQSTISFGNVIEKKSYKFYDDEEAFVASLDSVEHAAESLAMEKFQLYLNAKEDEQVRVMLQQLASCQNFDEQCSLWRNWANCEKSEIDDEWIAAVGCALMESGNYSPILNRIWITWRAITQNFYFGNSRDSAIPNHYYNKYRRMCYLTCLKRIETHPDDIFAMNCAAAIAGRTNMNRFGQNTFGNEAMIESFSMMPKRFSE